MKAVRHTLTAATTLLALAGCTLSERIAENARDAVSADEAMRRQRESFRQSAAGLAARRDAQRVNKPWLVGRAVPLSRDVMLPAAHRANVDTTLMFGGGGYDGTVPNVAGNVPAGPADRPNPLGLGYATLIPQNGNAAITIGDVPGVDVAGVTIDAGPVNSPVLVQVGTPGGQCSSSRGNPTVLHDVFVRIGGAAAGRATTSIVVNSDNTILDNIWAWRADHGNGVGWTVNTADTGLIVNGDNVTAYGLFVEHYQKTETIWNGDNGRVVFYQNELPYDPPNQAAWTQPSGELGYPALKVADMLSGVTPLRKSLPKPPQ